MTPIPNTQAFANGDPAGPLAPASFTPGLSAPEDDASQPEAEALAAAAREKIVQDDASRTWQGLMLQPWSEERRRLLDALCAADIPPPDFATCDALTWINGSFPRAVKALFLAAHEPQEWERQRPRLLAVIDKWGIDNVPADDLDQKMAAINFVRQMEEAHKSLIAQQYARRGKGRDHAGNSQRPSL